MDHPVTRNSSKQSQYRDGRQNKVVWSHRVTIAELTVIPWSIRSFRWGIILAFVGIGIICSGIYLILVTPPLQKYPNPTPTVLLRASYVPVTLAAILWFYPLITGGFMRAFRDYYLSRSQCPACHTDLHGQPIEEDDCVVCPECHAAWKITDQVSQP